MKHRHISCNINISFLPYCTALQSICAIKYMYWGNDDDDDDDGNNIDNDPFGLKC